MEEEKANFGKQTPQQLKEEIVTVIEASIQDTNFTEIFQDPVVEEALSPHPTHTTWLRCDTRGEYVAKNTKHLDDGDCKTSFHGATVAAAIKSVEDGLKVGPGKTGYKGGVYFHQNLASTGGYTVMASIDPEGSAYVWGAVVECLVDRHQWHRCSSTGPKKAHWVQPEDTIQTVTGHFLAIHLKDLADLEVKIHST